MVDTPLAGWRWGGGHAKKRIISNTLSITRRKVVVISQEEIEECLSEIGNVTTFCIKGRRWGTVVVIFVPEEEIIKHSTVQLKTVEWALLPTNLSKCVARDSMGKIPLKIKEKWMVVAILAVMKEEVRVVQATQIKQINWWN